ncbi:unnamed protein product [Clonostachys chloroleuca]|uniref:Amine oxidase domain-containing protein n=1 Tax=Clonostachys chloroleuca TaxID=1926264 RepID=A0AA35QEJ2_9HYPO|nr:unnamed protein product [Clonostachys chloroleuca]
MASSTHQTEGQARVAIIGTGLAGLTTAHLLHNDERQRYSVTLFEQSNKLSFDSASVAVKDGKTGAIERVDLPMRASAGGYYANLMRMYEYLEIPLHPIRFLFVFAKALPANNSSSLSFGSEPGTYFVHASNLHQTPPPWPGKRGVVAHIVEILYLIVCHFWFSVACFLVQPRSTASSGCAGREESFDEYSRRIWLPRRYITHYLLPLMSSVSTCSHDQLLAFPASDVVNYKRLSHGEQHYAVCGGVNQVQLRLAGGIKDVRLNAQVIQAMPLSDQPAGGVEIRWRSVADGSVSEEKFDRVILAVSPDVASRIFKPLASRLSVIPTIQVESSVLSATTGKGTARHSVIETGEPTSSQCMHHGKSISSAQVIALRSRFSDKGSESEALHTMPSGVVVSTCPLDGDLGLNNKVLHSAKFTRTIRSTESQALINSIMNRPSTSHRADDDGQAEQWTNGQDNVWLVGAWCWDGMVLLEGCIVSAMRVAGDFGVNIPWQSPDEHKAR